MLSNCVGSFNRLDSRLRGNDENTIGMNSHTPLLRAA